MSGIIGGAGSKSGIIGQTELDYEEGIHVVTATGSTSGTADVSSTVNQLSYTKIGRTVRVGGTIYVTNVSPISGTLMFSLPFVMQASVNGDGYWAVAVPTYNVNWTGDFVSGQSAPTNAKLEFWGINDDGTTSTCATTGYYRVQFVYETTA
tara:strand:+ start:473 stop:925 length:453 start_codon:yes stop_codon:yes gene_type:complete